jgi:predicted metal-dependent phosphoesterase TrpH
MERTVATREYPVMTAEEALRRGLLWKFEYDKLKFETQELIDNYQRTREQRIRDQRDKGK